MSVKDQGAKVSRRGFLKGAAMVSGAAAASTLSTGASAGVTQSTEAEKPEQARGYHVTAHIREYYEKARF